MRLIWSPKTALNSYVDTIKSCDHFKQSGEPELISAMAGGWQAKLIVEAWTRGGGPTAATSIGLSIAANHMHGRHVCIVQDERSRSEYNKAWHDTGTSSPLPEVAVGEAEEVMKELEGIDFMVVDCKGRDFAKVLRFAKISHKGAVLVCRNNVGLERFRWGSVLNSRACLVRSLFLPVGKGVDIAHVAYNGGESRSSNKLNSGRWITHTDQKSGEEHIFRRQ